MYLKDYVPLPSFPSGGTDPGSAKAMDKMAEQAHYQDMFKDIQAMREDEFSKELREGRRSLSGFGCYPDYTSILIGLIAGFVICKLVK